MSQASQPQAYPGRMIRLVVPFTAGGSSDVQARMLADRLGKLYKQSVVVDNKPGAGGHIGGKFVADAPADGYTLLLGSIGLHATYGVFKKLSYDPATDLKVVTVLAEMPHVVVANPALPANDLKQLVALARKQPDTINFGSAGVGSSVHMIGELFKLTANAPIVHVPYKGSTAALNDLLAGQIQLMFENPPTTLAHIRGGKLKALAVTGKTRLPALPEVPTAIESGFAAFEATSWTTVAVSAKVPDAIADKLNADIRKIVAAPEFRQGLSEQGMTPVANTRDAATRFIAAEKLRWDKVIQQGRIAAE
ncbi:tripartite tricarboxylate transporter substrate binding protein [Variovorax sp. KBS0712]|uniref:tripartite tricarboxylate transporter substrate binding protein n=1 Tax=Variovorax sp. KBS0712 TaxID=2578111 RepID=UPI0021B0E772|nr:tripartite tricarboxylate transporter substrate binding protein [Variovorax sp. KBS0712]